MIPLFQRRFYGSFPCRPAAYLRLVAVLLDNLKNVASVSENLPVRRLLLALRASLFICDYHPGPSLRLLSRSRCACSCFLSPLSDCDSWLQRPNPHWTLVLIFEKSAQYSFPFSMLVCYLLQLSPCFVYLSINIRFCFPSLCPQQQQSCPENLLLTMEILCVWIPWWQLDLRKNTTHCQRSL